MNSKDPMQKIELDEENLGHSGSRNIPKECEIFIKEIKSAKIVPINEDLNSTMNRSTYISSKSKKLESIKNKLSSFTSETMVTVLNSRSNFIRNTFLLLGLQSILSIIIISIAQSNESLYETIKYYRFLMIISSTILSIMGILMLVYRRMFRVRVFRWVLFAVFSTTKGYISAYIACIFNTPGPIATFIMFGGTFFALAMYSIHSKEKFDNKSAIFVSFLSCSACFAICFTVYYEFFYIVISIYIIILLFIWFVVYDIQVIAGGRFEEFTYDDYVPVSLIVHIEIIGVLFYIGYLFNSSDE
ncbi:hypothetical protein SteCoe_37958 [Stentor coeruleus]|uniref:Uncharacterized protein n=1 Tax=Stentor coeruleus TaxID=5963 RepID=A0A1R2AM22_9CILI|nr:hypothetical protein SteCoe_37958 [Stentor coeruleus]